VLFNVKKLFNIIIFLSCLVFMNLAYAQPQSDIFIFISFSMPTRSIKALLHQSKRVNGLLVLNGFAEGSLLKTLKRVKVLVEGEKTGLVVNPLWFRKFHIEQVPAFVIAGPGIKTEIVYGDVPLRAVLNEFINHSDSVPLAQKAKALLDRLEGRHL
jgi:conjugal transfer pilus assembly protein TrbC